MIEVCPLLKAPRKPFYFIESYIVVGDYDVTDTHTISIRMDGEEEPRNLDFISQTEAELIVTTWDKLVDKTKNHQLRVPLEDIYALSSYIENPNQEFCFSQPEWVYESLMKQGLEHKDISDLCEIYHLRSSLFYSIVEHEYNYLCGISIKYSDYDGDVHNCMVK